MHRDLEMMTEKSTAPTQTLLESDFAIALVVRSEQKLYPSHQQYIMQAMTFAVF